MRKIHWPESLAGNTKSAARRRAYCGKTNPNSISTNAEEVSCRMCVHRMIKRTGYKGNRASNVWLAHYPN